MDSAALTLVEANLKALAQLDLPLARRIIAPVDDNVLDTEDIENPVYLYHHSRRALRASPAVVSELLTEVDTERPLLLFGAGDVPLVEAALAHAPEQKVIVWDRDPCILRLLLASRDWCDALLNGQLLLCLGVDLVAMQEHRPAGNAQK